MRKKICQSFFFWFCRIYTHITQMFTDDHFTHFTSNSLLQITQLFAESKFPSPQNAIDLYNEAGLCFMFIRVHHWDGTTPLKSIYPTTWPLAFPNAPIILTMLSPYLKSIYPVTLELYERQMKYFIEYIYLLLLFNF